MGDEEAKPPRPLPYTVAECILIARAETPDQVEKLAAKFGRTYDAIVYKRWVLLRAMGKNRKRSCSPARDVDMEIRLMLADGMSQGKIAAALGMTKNQIAGWLWRNKRPIGPVARFDDIRVMVLEGARQPVVPSKQVPAQGFSMIGGTLGRYVGTSRPIAG